MTSSELGERDVTIEAGLCAILHMALSRTIQHCNQPLINVKLPRDHLNVDGRKKCPTDPQAITFEVESLSFKQADNNSRGSCEYVGGSPSILMIYPRHLPSSFRALTLADSELVMEKERTKEPRCTLVPKS